VPVVSFDVDDVLFVIAFAAVGSTCLLSHCPYCTRTTLALFA